MLETCPILPKTRACDLFQAATSSRAAKEEVGRKGDLDSLGGHRLLVRQGAWPLRGLRRTRHACVAHQAVQAHAVAPHLVATELVPAAADVRLRRRAANGKCHGETTQNSSFFDLFCTKIT